MWGGHYHLHFHHSSVANSTMVEAELCVDNMELDLGTVNVQGGMNQLLTQQVRKRKDPPGNRSKMNHPAHIPKSIILLPFCVDLFVPSVIQELALLFLGH